VSTAAPGPDGQEVFRSFRPRGEHPTLCAVSPRTPPASCRQVRSFLVWASCAVLRLAEIKFQGQDAVPASVSAEVRCTSVKRVSLAHVGHGHLDDGPSPRTHPIREMLPVECAGKIQQSLGSAGVAVCVRGRYRFAVEAKTGLPERDQAEIRRRVHFRSSRFLPLGGSAACKFRPRCSFTFGARVDGLTIPNPTRRGLNRVRKLSILGGVPALQTLSLARCGG
jgi:hypothetical protein